MIDRPGHIGTNIVWFGRSGDSMDPFRNSCYSAAFCCPCRGQLTKPELPFRCRNGRHRTPISPFPDIVKRFVIENMPAKSRDLLLAVTTRSDSSTFRWKAYPGLVSEGIQSGCSGGRELSKAYQLLLVSAIRQYSRDGCASHKATDLLTLIEVGTYPKAIWPRILG